MCVKLFQNMFRTGNAWQKVQYKDLLRNGQWKRAVHTRVVVFSDNSNEDTRRIPRRILKRMNALGLSESDVSSKSRSPDMMRTEQAQQSLDEIKHLVDNMVIGEKMGDAQHMFPSDKQSHITDKRDQTNMAVRSKVDPKETSLVLFPGQGSQFVGMGRKLLHYKDVKDLYDMSSDILGYDLLDVCLNGPKSQLDKTVICQPAVFVTSVAALEKLHEEHPQVANNCAGTAGFSVGEYSALVFSGMLSFQDALKVVKVRAEAMQKASEMIPSGMMTVFIGHNAKLNFAMLAAREYCSKKLHIENPVCYIANYLYSDCKVVAGNEEALQFIQENAKGFGIKRTKRLPVSGAFHTQLMDTARDPVVKMLRKLEVKKPLFRVHSNVTTKRYHSSSDLVKLLNKQIVKPVKWEQTLHMLYSRQQGEDFPHTYEVGPGKQMGTLLRMVNVKAYANFTNIEV